MPQCSCNELELEGWTRVIDALPVTGQYIDGLTAFTMGTWSEVFDELAPLGFMSHWRLA